MVAISAMFIWKPPSPEIAQTVSPGRARCTPMAAGTANPMVPRPPDVMCELGSRYGYSLATHIWCWPTSVTMVQRPSVAWYSDARIVSGARSPRNAAARGRVKSWISASQRSHVRGCTTAARRCVTSWATPATSHTAWPPWCSPARDVAGVAHDPHRHRHVLPDLGAVQVDVHDARPRREAGGIARDAVVEPQPDAHDQVGVLDGAVHPHLAVHPRHAEEQRVAVGERADAEQRGDHRDTGLLRQRAHFGVGVADDHPVPHHDQRALGGGYEAGGLAHPVLDRGRHSGRSRGGPTKRLGILVA